MRTTMKFTVLAVAAVIAVASLAGADDWQKLGSKAFAFKDEPITLTMKAKDASVGEIKLKVNGTWVRVTQLTLSFSDGTTQTLEQAIDVEPGLTSAAIAVDGGPKQVASIELTCESAATARGGRGTIAVLGS